MANSAYPEFRSDFLRNLADKYRALGRAEGLLLRILAARDIDVPMTPGRASPNAQTSANSKPGSVGLTATTVNDLLELIRAPCTVAPPGVRAAAPSVVSSVNEE